MAFVIGCDVSHVFGRQGRGNAAHGGVFALAFLIGGEGRDDVTGALARNHGDFVNLGKTGLVAFDAVAADAQSDFGFTCFGVTSFLGLDK